MSSPETAFTYAELDEATQVMAGLLAEHGVGPGGVVQADRHVVRVALGGAGPTSTSRPVRERRTSPTSTSTSTRSSDTVV